MVVLRREETGDEEEGEDDVERNGDGEVGQRESDGSVRPKRCVCT